MPSGSHPCQGLTLVPDCGPLDPRGFSCQTSGDKEGTSYSSGGWASELSRVGLQINQVDGPTQG